MLHFLARIAKEKAPDILSLREELPHMRAACMLEVRGATDEVNQLNGEVKQLTKETLAAEQANENAFAGVMRPFADSLKVKLEELSSTKDRLLGLASKTLQLYGEDSSSAYKLVDTVKVLQEFIRSLEAAAADNARIELAEERKKKKEAQQRAAALRKQQNQSQKLQRGTKMGGEGIQSSRRLGRRSLLPGKNKAYRASQSKNASNASPLGGDGASPWGVALKQSPLAGPSKMGGTSKMGGKLKRRSTVRYSVTGSRPGGLAHPTRGRAGTRTSARNSARSSRSNRAVSGASTRGLLSSSQRRQSSSRGGGGGLLNMLVGHAKDGNWDKVTSSSPSAMIKSVREATHESDDDDDDTSSDEDNDWDV
jgi:hypothetical protein